MSHRSVPTSLVLPASLDGLADVAERPGDAVVRVLLGVRPLSAFLALGALAALAASASASAASRAFLTTAARGRLGDALGGGDGRVALARLVARRGSRRRARSALAWSSSCLLPIRSSTRSVRVARPPGSGAASAGRVPRRRARSGERRSRQTRPPLAIRSRVAWSRSVASLAADESPAAARTSRTTAASTSAASTGSRIAVVSARTSEAQSATSATDEPVVKSATIPAASRTAVADAPRSSTTAARGTRRSRRRTSATSVAEDRARLSDVADPLPLGSVVGGDERVDDDARLVEREGPALSARGGADGDLREALADRVGGPAGVPADLGVGRSAAGHRSLAIRR